MSIFDLFREDRRITALERVVATLDAEHRRDRLDFDDLYESTRKLQKRVSTERARMERLHTAEAPESAAIPGGNGRLSTGGMLTERQKQIQQEILKRRTGGA